MNGACRLCSGVAVYAARMTQVSTAKFRLGQLVRHRDGAFQGVVLDADAAYAGSPAETGHIPPDQPFYKVYALGEDGGFIAYAAESMMDAAPDLGVLSSADERAWFTVDAAGRHAPKAEALH